MADTIAHLSVAPGSGGNALDAAASEQDLERLFELLLQRPIGDDTYRAERARSGVTMEQVITELLASPEFALRSRLHIEDVLDGSRFRLPDQLAVHDGRPRRVLLVGSCAFDTFHDQLSAARPETLFERITFNNASALPLIEPAQAAAYDFQLVQIPLRTVMPEHMYFNDSNTEESARAWLEVAKAAVTRNFEAATAYNRDYAVETFVLNFLTPQQNPLGRLQPPYSLRNPVAFVDALNRHLYELIEGRPNMFLIDAEQIAASLGKRYILDDSVSHLNHGSFLGEIGTSDDAARIEPIGRVATIYGERNADYVDTVFAEALAAHDTIHQRGAIKLVIFDLDDTLWRGIAAERIDALDHTMTEGWPLGVLEAASFLHKRGIMLAVVSKNDEENARTAWTALHEHRFPFDHFIAHRINWKPKAENVAEIIALANVGADAVLFVDDNPVERTRVREAIPGLRTLETTLAEWRRVLLWAPELQPAAITDEALGRAASIKAKAQREVSAQETDADFLAQAGVEVTPRTIAATDDPMFQRALELINKTNQFNTTGQRWTFAELTAFFAEGGVLLTLSVRDRYAVYGLTAVVFCRDGEITQYLMSCRVFGMRIEHAAIAIAIAQARQAGADRIVAWTTETGRNHLSLKLFEELGFTSTDRHSWTLAADVSPSVPSHIRINDV